MAALLAALSKFLTVGATGAARTRTAGGVPPLAPPGTTVAGAAAAGTPAALGTGAWAETGVVEAASTKLALA
jgi:hypothetical protein